MYLKKSDDNTILINLDIVMFIKWDKKKTIFFNYLNRRIEPWDYSSEQKAAEDMDKIKKITSKRIMIDEEG